MLKCLSVHLNLRRKSPPTLKIFGTLPVMSFPSDSLPAPWDFLALLSILFCLLLLPQGQFCSFFSPFHFYLGSFLGKKLQVEQAVLGQAAISCTFSSLRTHWILSEQDFIQHSRLRSSPVVVSSRALCSSM